MRVGRHSVAMRPMASIRLARGGGIRRRRPMIRIRVARAPGGRRRLRLTVVLPRIVSASYGKMAERIVVLGRARRIAGVTILPRLMMLRQSIGGRRMMDDRRRQMPVMVPHGDWCEGSKDPGGVGTVEITVAVEGIVVVPRIVV